VGSGGKVYALDLASENIERVSAHIRNGVYPANIQTRVGSVLSLPFADASFDCVWMANVVQYLTTNQFTQVITECKRVLKSGGTVAIKEFDSSIFQFPPLDPSIIARLIASRKAKQSQAGILGASCGTSIPSRLRHAGLTDIFRKGWLVERWAPIEPFTRTFVEDLFKFFANIAVQYNVTGEDLRILRETARDPSILLDDPDFCLREFFVLTVGRVS
jgi:arsenite methyltransferase